MFVAREVVHIASVVVCIVEFESVGWPKSRRHPGILETWLETLGWPKESRPFMAFNTTVGKGMLCFLLTSWRQHQASKWTYPTCLPLYIASCWLRFLVAARSGWDSSWWLFQARSIHCAVLGLKRFGKLWASQEPTSLLWLHCRPDRTRYRTLVIHRWAHFGILTLTWHVMLLEVNRPPKEHHWWM